MNSHFKREAVVMALMLPAVIGIGLIATLIVTSCGDTYREAHYASLAEAEKDGAIKRGWIPDYLPASSRNILEFHRLEHSRTWCSFDFSPSDSDRLRAELADAPVIPKPVATIQRPRVSWWPQFLQGEPEIENLRRNGFSTYVATKPTVAAFPNERFFYLFAIDWTRGHAYFYEAIGDL